ncbi:MAG: hypothetical protein ACRCST_01840 [Turicibacter sp.]
MAEKKVDFKSINKTQKKEYIWEYYRYHILITLIVIIYSGYSMFNHYTSLNYVYNLTLLGGYSNDYGAFDVFEKKLTEVALENPGKRESAKVLLYTLDNIKESLDPLTSTYYQKFILQVAAGELDVIVLNEVDFDYFYEQGMFKPLSSYEGIDFECLNDNQLIRNAEDQDVYGIKLKENENFESLDYQMLDKILAVANTSTHPEENEKVINWIIRNK